MRYRFVGDHLETLDDGQSLAPGDFVDLDDEALEQPRAAELLEGSQLIEAAEEEEEEPAPKPTARARSQKGDKS